MKDGELAKEDRKLWVALVEFEEANEYGAKEGDEVGGLKS
jgi:hypothetical protein